MFRTCLVVVLDQIVSSLTIGSHNSTQVCDCYFIVLNQHSLQTCIAALSILSLAEKYTRHGVQHSVYTCILNYRTVQQLRGTAGHTKV